MTTVAYKDGIMAADTLAMDAHGLKAFGTKIYRINIGGEYWLLGTAGEYGLGRKIAAEIDGYPMLQQVESLEMKSDPDDKQAAILACGDVILYKAGNFWRRTHRQFHAVGSGRDFALAAMHLGKSAEEAVVIACEFDGYSGGEIESVTP